MATLTTVADAPGRGGFGALLMQGQRTVKCALYRFAFDAEYPSGGEDISAIWDDFTEVLAIFVAQNDATVADVRLPVVDRTNKKLILVKTLSSGANAEAAEDSSGIADVDLLVFGR
jgi:hypothetical protein